MRMVRAREAGEHFGPRARGAAFRWRHEGRLPAWVEEVDADAPPDPAPAPANQPQTLGELGRTLHPDSEPTKARRAR